MIGQAIGFELVSAFQVFSLGGVKVAILDGRRECASAKMVPRNLRVFPNES